jgi:exosortase E/protease (VPEID-CTERM system)
VLASHSKIDSKFSQPTTLLRLPRYFLGRLFLLAALLAVDMAVLTGIPHVGALFDVFAAFGIVTFAAFVGLGYSDLKQQRQELRFSIGFYIAHLACVAAVAAFLWFFHYTAPILSLIVLVAIAFLALACIPLRAWIATIRATKWLWLYSLLVGLAAWYLRVQFQSFWYLSANASGSFLQVLTFHSVKVVLRFFIPDIQVDPATFTIGTQRFAVIIAPRCSGLEGLGLVLAFTTIWLWYFRKESRFPQALLLVPCALACVWALNILRIAGLILIGNTGADEIAMVGFHSQAGWIAFTTVAFSFSMATRKLQWVRKIQYEVPSGGAALSGSSVAIGAERDYTGESPATGAYLVPFLAILAASFVSKAASGYFEWLYPLRFLAAIIAIWYYWPDLKKLNWRCGWLAPVTGAAIFALWVVPSLWTHAHATNPLGAALENLSPIARWSWIALRVAAAVITVPIAEELAFRGYLARRLVDREFDSLPFSSVTLLSIGLSSVAFGLMHGQQWMAGILAGLAYAGVMKWRGRIGDAIVAHATSNLLLAVWVLVNHDWSQW